MLIGKLESAIWFLKRPQLFPQFLHLLKQRLFSLPEPDTRPMAEKWCAERAVSVSEAVRLVTGAPMDMPVDQKFADTFREAHARADACPVRMGGPGALDLLYWVALRVRAGKAIETGVAYGWSSLALLLALEETPGSRLISTDMPYLRVDNDDFVGLVVPDRLRDRWELLRRADRQVLPGALHKLGTIDLCHYDSDKSYSGRMWAYPLLWKALRPGGVFISDDIDDNLGFRDYAAQIGMDPIVVRVSNDSQSKFVGILIKK